MMKYFHQFRVYVMLSILFLSTYVLYQHTSQVSSETLASGRISAIESENISRIGKSRSLIHQAHVPAKRSVDGDEGVIASSEL